MTVEIEFDHRLSSILDEICEANGISVEEYVVDAVRQKVDLDRYGDLNDKFAKKEEEDEAAYIMNEFINPPKEMSPEVEELLNDPNAKVMTTDRTVDELTPLDAEEWMKGETEKVKPVKRTGKRKLQVKTT